MSVTQSTIPFVSFGADHACEQLNRLMNAHSVLTWISNNPNARQRFFLATLALSCLTKDFKSQFYSAGSQAAVHHDLSQESIRPSSESKKPLRATEIHLLLRAVPSTTLSRMHTSQMSMYHRSSTVTTSVRSSMKTMSERINGDVSLWAPVKKRENNLMYFLATKSTQSRLGTRLWI